MAKQAKRLEIERVQSGVRMERRILKVLKALAEFKNLTLGDLLEGIVLNAFDGKAPVYARNIAQDCRVKECLRARFGRALEQSTEGEGLGGEF